MFKVKDLKLEVQNLTSIIPKQEEANIQLQSALQSQRQLIEDKKISMKTQYDQMKQEIKWGGSRVNQVKAPPFKEVEKNQHITTSSMVYKLRWCRYQHVHLG